MPQPSPKPLVHFDLRCMCVCHLSAKASPGSSRLSELISIICQDSLISPAPIWIHKDIAVGYVCGKAIALLNQRSHLQSSLSNKQELV